MKMERKRLKTELDNSLTGRTVKHLKSQMAKMMREPQLLSTGEVTVRAKIGESSILMNLRRTKLRDSMKNSVCIVANHST